MSALLFDEGQVVSAQSVIIPRYYQEEDRDSTLDHLDRGITRLLTVLPTGQGKTSVMAWQMEAIFRAYGYDKFLVIVHREELIQQIKERCAQLIPQFRVTQHGGGRKGDLTANICVASVQSVHRADNHFLEKFAPQVVVTDEAHRAAARTYQEVYMRSGVYEGTAISLGYTATAHRLDNKALFGHGATSFQAVSYTMSLRRAIEEGWLMDIIPFRRVSGVDLSKVKRKGGEYDERALAEVVNTYGRNILAFQTWKEKAGNKRTLVFCVDVAHAFAVAEVFEAGGYHPAK